MAGTVTINLQAKIHAEIYTEDEIVPSNYPAILDPITKSYSDYGKLVYYRLSIIAMNGISNPVLLQNGKNSRFTASGRGTCTIELLIEDEHGNSDTDEVTINIG